MDVRERTEKAIAKTLAESGLLPEAVEDYVVSDLASDVYSAVLAALKEAGYAVVPMEPTSAIVNAGVKQSNSWPVVPDGVAISPAHPFMMTCCWRAMLAAAQEHA